MGPLRDDGFAEPLLKRCSVFAREQLEQLLGHPFYPLVVARLMSIPDRIYGSDVHAAMLDIAKQYYRDATASSQRPAAQQGDTQPKFKNT